MLQNMTTVGVHYVASSSLCQSGDAHPSAPGPLITPDHGHFGMSLQNEGDVLTDKTPHVESQKHQDEIDHAEGHPVVCMQGGR